MTKRVIWFLVLTALGCCIGTTATRISSRNADGQATSQRTKTAKSKQMLPPGIKVDKGAVFIPPGQAPPENPTAEAVVTMHSPEQTNGKLTVLRGLGGIPVHFTLTHRGRRIPSRYRVAVIATTQGTKAHNVAAERLMDPYELVNGQTKTDEFATLLPVPPGYYSVAIEIRSLYPVRNATGQKLGDYLVVSRQERWRVQVGPD
jgi:hypothetical protein